jgi:hypothetical protein
MYKCNEEYNLCFPSDEVKIYDHDKFIECEKKCEPRPNRITAPLTGKIPSLSYISHLNESLYSISKIPIELLPPKFSQKLIILRIFYNLAHVPESRKYLNYYVYLLINNCSIELISKIIENKIIEPVYFINISIESANRSQKNLITFKEKIDAVKSSLETHFHPLNVFIDMIKKNIKQLRKMMSLFDLFSKDLGGEYYKIVHDILLNGRNIIAYLCELLPIYENYFGTHKAEFMKLSKEMCYVNNQDLNELSTKFNKLLKRYLDDADKPRKANLKIIL